MDEPTLVLELPRLLSQKTSWISLSLLLRIPIRKRVVVTVNTDPNTKIEGHIWYSRGRVFNIMNVYSDAMGSAEIEMYVSTKIVQHTQLYLKTYLTHLGQQYERFYIIEVDLFKENADNG